ncbi:MAG: hypothetical protein P4L85_14455 [Paludisphaera borealis]|nr:hypothetical protein [Paludisphaera borealis]MDR3620549.1 hypothetical protein [Paludisphaera borealis]
MTRKQDCKTKKKDMQDGMQDKKYDKQDEMQDRKTHTHGWN